MKQLTDEEILDRAIQDFARRSRLQRTLEQEAIEYLENQARKSRNHPYRKARKQRSASEEYRENNWTLYSLRSK